MQLSHHGHCNPSNRVKDEVYAHTAFPFMLLDQSRDIQYNPLHPALELGSIGCKTLEIHRNHRHTMDKHEKPSIGKHTRFVSTNQHALDLGRLPWMTTSA